MLVKTEFGGVNSGINTVYFEVEYQSDHYNNYINNTIREHELTKKYMSEGFHFPTVIATYDDSVEAEHAKACKQLKAAEKHKKGFPAQYYDALEKRTQMIAALDIVQSDMFVGCKNDM